MNPRFSFLPAFAVLAALGLPGGVSAQQAARPPAAAPYLLGADDVISIQVTNFPELCVPTVTVPPDGKITVPDLNSVSVAGKTTAQVAQLLQTRWKHYYVGAFVTVTLTQRRHQTVQVYGFVTHSQAVEFQPGLRLTEALAEAGGAAENGDLAHVAVTHKNGIVQTTDASAGGPDQDITLAPSDTVYVPERHLQISVLGEVAKPGSYEYKDKMTVLDALKDADNTNPETANLTQATLLRRRREYPVDLNALLVKGDQSQNFTLIPGDRLFIPTLQNRIDVEGAVGHSGHFNFQANARLADAIANAGGLVTGAADLKLVSVIHVDKLHNTATPQTVDIGRFYQHGEQASNILLQPGDVIYVPLKGNKPRPLDLLGGALGLASGFRVLGL